MSEEDGCHVGSAPSRQRPHIELEPADHPLAIEQRQGIAFDGLQEVYATRRSAWPCYRRDMCGRCTGRELPLDTTYCSSGNAMLRSLAGSPGLIGGLKVFD